MNKAPKKMKNFGEERALFLDKLSDLAVQHDCKGAIQGEPPLPPPTSETLSLEQIARIQVMMGFPERAALAWELGSNPSEEHNGISLRRLNDAFANIHGKKVHEQLVEWLDQYGAKAENHKKHRTTKK